MAGARINGSGSQTKIPDYSGIVAFVIFLAVTVIAGITGAAEAKFDRAALIVAAPAPQFAFPGTVTPARNKITPTADPTILLAQNRQRQTLPPQNPQLIVDNLTGYPVDLLYVDQNRQYVPYKTIPNGQRLVEPSRLNFTWYFGVGGQTIIGTYTMSNLPQQALRLDTNMLIQAGIQPPQPNRQALPRPGQQQQLPPAGLLPPPRQQAGGQQGLLPPPGQQGRGQQGLLPPPRQQAGGQQGLLPPPRQQAGTPTALPTRLPTDADLLANVSPQNIVHPGLPPEAKVPPPLPPVATVLPKRRAFSNQPWSESPHESVLLLAGGKAVTANQHGQLEFVDMKSARSRATWFMEKIEGTKFFYFRNVQDVDNYIYIEPDASEGSLVKYGSRGGQMETGKWRRDPKNDYFFYNVGRPELLLFFTGNSITVTADTNPRLGFGWQIATVKSFKELMGFLTDNVDTLVQLNDNVNALDRKVAQEAADKRAAEEKTRLDFQARPWVAGGGNGENFLTVRLGFRGIEEPAPGVKGLRYNFDPPQQPRIGFGPIPSTNTQVQTVQLILRPKVYAFTQENKLYIRVKTENGTQINMLTGGRPPDPGRTKNQFYIGAVRAGVYMSAGPPILISPVNENTITDAGINQDQTIGGNLSIESFGGDFSQSRGTSVNFSAKDYRVSGRNTQIGAEYSWEGCGLAVTTKSNDNCTYATPEDMWDSETASLRRIKDVALSMPLMITDTLFVVDRPASQLPDELNIKIAIGMVFHAARRVRNQDKQFTKDFIGGAFFVFRPDQWDIDKNMRNQNIIKNATYTTKGAKQVGSFDINLAVDISQLKPFIQ